jgi:hypothetical protein
MGPSQVIASTRVTDRSSVSLRSRAKIKEKPIHHHSKGRIRLGRILSVGKIAGRLIARARALSVTGCSVCSAIPEEVSRLVTACFYRIVIVGEGLSDPEAAELAVCTRAANPRSKLVLLMGVEPRPNFVEALFDVVVENHEDDAVLTRFLQSLLLAA